MALFITLGYTENGGTADPTVLYAGSDGDSARQLLENPPIGIIRTGGIFHPAVNPNLYFPENVNPPLELLPDPAPAPELLTDESPPPKSKK